MIEWKNRQITITRQCDLLDLPRSTACHIPVEIMHSEDKFTIKNTIDRIYYNESSYGVRRIKNELHKLGYNSDDRTLVKRYIQKMDIYVFYPGPNLSKRAKSAKLYPNLLRNLVFNRTNQIW